jgi:putative endonuclease
MTTRSQIGKYAEDLATQYLTSKSYEILFRNYRKPWGEIDIIAREGEVVVFVEVKANTVDSENFQPELRASNEKMRKVVRTARTYLAQYELNESEWRLDVVAVTIDKDGGVAKIKHFKNIDM